MATASLSHDSSDQGAVPPGALWGGRGGAVSKAVPAATERRPGRWAPPPLRRQPAGLARASSLVRTEAAVKCDCT